MLEIHSPGIEEIKRLNMVDFLSRYYGLNFTKCSVNVKSYCGDQYRCLSPFKSESNASFFVREVDSHWLFKDFSSGYAGSLIDFVLYKEGFSKVWEALNHIGNLLSADALNSTGRNSGSTPNHTNVKILSPSPSPTSRFKSSSSKLSSSSSSDKGYDIEKLYQKFRGNGIGCCRDYLLSRGICVEVVDQLCEEGLLLHNRFKGKSYCCFAVYDAAGQLRCLDNHYVEGREKFVLGSKHPFSLDWEQLGSRERVFVTESIIDCLSIKTLEGIDFCGVALLGNVINFNSDLFASSVEIVSALDGDEGGFRAFLDLEESFSDREVQVYDFGDSKDANQHLLSQMRGKRARNLSGQDKLLLYQAFHGSENKTELARQWGINRSYMYEIVRECEELILSGFSQRRRGRKRENEPETMTEACNRLKELEAENRRLDEERERHWVRNEFMKVRLKWSEQEVAELRGEVESESNEISKNRKKHLKKKRRKKW